MQEAPFELAVKPDREIRELDHFWGKIERLILHSSRDEQTRQRDNASLPAFCHTDAEPRVHRDQKLKRPKNTTCNSKDAITQMKKYDLSTDIPTHHRRKPRSTDSNDYRAKQTKSECSVLDLDVVVKESTIPTSERLWRFAIRNRQQKQEHECTVGDLSHIPSEAVYDRFEHRLITAKKDKDRVQHASLDLRANISENRKLEKNRVRVDACDNNRTITSRTKLTTQQKKDDRSKSLTNTPNITSVRKPISAFVPNHALSRNIPNDLHGALVKRPTQRMPPSEQKSSISSELKTDYLNTCSYQSSLRHQIDMLQAELHMMQAKGFHKTPAVVNTITLGSKYADKHEHNSKDTVLLNTRRNAQTSFVVQQKVCVNNEYECWHNKMKGISRKDAPYGMQKMAPESTNEGSHTGLPYINGGIPPRCACSQCALTTFKEHPPTR